MKTIPDITCIGEVLIDFISTKKGVTLSDVPGFVKCAGGAAANVAVGLAKLGILSAFVGKVGNDPFGKFLHRQLREEGVDVSGLRTTQDYNTRLAFVSLSKSSERDFKFWEQHPADEQLQLSDVNPDRLRKSKIVHISSFLLLNEPARSTALRIARRLKQKRCDISFDPNLRLSLWKSHMEARKIHSEMVRSSTILKLNEEEALFLTNQRKLGEAIERLFSLGPSVVVVTMGREGCYVRTKHGSTFVKAIRVKTVDTTGCGDGFLAGLLSGIVNTNLQIYDISLESWYSICRTANAVGAIVATRRGVFDALPTSRELRHFLLTQS